MPVDCLDLAAALADALEVPLPGVGLPRHLWLLGTGSHHDAAELVTHLFIGSGRSCRAIASDGHAQLSGLVGPADTVVLVGPPEDEFLQLGRRVATGAGALVVELAEQDAAYTDSTTRHLTAAIAPGMRSRSASVAPGAPPAMAMRANRIAAVRCRVVLSV